MEVIIILLPLALMLGAFFICCFIWSVKKGQYDDLDTPRFRLLIDDESVAYKNPTIIKDNK